MCMLFSFNFSVHIESNLVSFWFWRKADNQLEIFWKVKSFVYFVNVRLNLATVNVFAEVVKVINCTGMKDVKLVWYFVNVTLWICLSGIESMVLGRPDFVWLLNFLQLKQNFLIHLVTMINCTFAFPTRNVFDCFDSVMTQFQLIKHEFPN